MPEYRFRDGAAAKIAGDRELTVAKRVMLVTDKGVRSAGLTRGAEDGVEQSQRFALRFEDVVADPPSHVIESAAKRARSEKIDLVLSIGGGRRSDTAKLVAYLTKSDEPLDAIYGVGLARGQRLPLILAPTTAGTGSEVTPISIVTTPTTEKKAWCRRGSCRIGRCSIRN